MELSCYAATFLVAVPFMYYFVLWTRPKLWMDFCRRTLKKDPCLAMYHFAAVGKLIQFTALGWWYMTAARPITVKELVSLPTFRLLVGLLAIIVGQALNVGAFRAVGMEGIFYGCRFGKKIPWCTSWPFGGPFSIRHPQYVGAFSTLLGAAVLVATAQHMEAGLVFVTLSLVLCWTSAAIWEDYWP